MKEKKLTDKKILQELDKKGFIEFCPICEDCILHVVELTLAVYPHANFNVHQIEDMIYQLSVSI